MTNSFLISLDEVEFKAFLREALKETLKEVNGDGEQASEIFSVAEAAAFLKLQISTLYEKTAAKGIPHFKKGNRLYFHRAELEAWLYEGKVKTQKELQSEAATYTMQRHNKAA